MKRALLLILIAIFTLGAYAQYENVGKHGPKLTTQMAHPDQVGDYSNAVIGQKMYDNTVVGTTWYDSQTINYGNIMSRMWLYGDGTIGAAWTCAGQDLDPQRGIGYNYYDGTEWGVPDLHVGVPDDERLGTTCYAPWGANGEIACSYKYVAGEGPIYFFKRETKGTGDWVMTEATGPEGASIVWQAMHTSGENNEYIHLLAYSYDVDVLGQTNALLYYRSNDGGETWDPEGIVIDGLGSDEFTGVNALSYNFSNSVGSTIAFTYGFDYFGGLLFKSTDNGDSWEKTVVMESHVDPLDYPTEIEPFGAGIGSSAVALDSDGKAHVVFPRAIRAYTDPDWSHYPWTADGLIYWNEDMEPLDSTIISTTGLENLEAGGYLCGYVFGYDPVYGVEVPENQPNYANSMCAFPTIAIDAQDNIFVSSSNYAPEYVTGDGFFYHHIIANSSFDGGLTWNGMVDLNDDIQFIFSECVFSAMAHNTTNTLYFLFQEDFAAGSFEWPNEQAEATENKMYMMSVPKSVFVGIDENSLDLNFEISELYPNPTNSNVQFNISLESNSQVYVNLVNTIGQVVKTDRLDEMTGDQRISFDVSDLKAGIYYCNVTVDGQTISRKLVVY